MGFPRGLRPRWGCLGALLPALRDVTWRPGIGDPTLLGWLTTAAFLVAAWLCWRAARATGDQAPPNVARGTRAFWAVLAALMLLLGLNKQLDVQTLLTEVGRALAKAQGWYEARRLVQAVFVGWVALVGVAGVLALAVLVRRGRPPQGLALAGLAMLIGFVVLRAASFHHADRILGLRLAGAALSHLLELAGTACVALSARAAKPLRTHPAPRPRPRS